MIESYNDKSRREKINTKSSNKWLVGSLVGVIIGFLIMIMVIVAAAIDTISKQKENHLRANCLDEFATIECFDKRIKGFQFRKEHQLRIESYKNNG